MIKISINVKNLLATNNGGQVYEMTYDDNNALPDPTAVQGLINLNTTTAGINGQITNTWNNIGSTVGSQGQGNIGTTLEDLFQAFGYITVYGSTFLANSNSGSNAGAPQKGVQPQNVTAYNMSTKGGSTTPTPAVLGMQKNAKSVTTSVSSLFGKGKTKAKPQKTIDDYPEYKQEILK
ncbi:hypothetical protein D6856_13950 [Butyrivibrio sp. XB500-5]|uniref:hypothetical protein n=1 Tax=Butyrivibrio sp. XB500-5 TaxID=2364880 RepID=UPI000EA98F99|nr:hypothetical protein [Butyrivibrio sp. XB500-5]RKM57754.1 hypothetical protein D6856_13950 [Butyrivibrio sp. XB500-5]